MPDSLTIKQMRQLRGLTLEEVSKSDSVRISREHLGKIENDFSALRSAKIDTVLSLANLYGYKLGDIDFGK